MKANRKQQISFHVGIQYLLRAAIIERICSQKADLTRICYLFFCDSAISTSPGGEVFRKPEGNSQESKKAGSRLAIVGHSTTRSLTTEKKLFSLFLALTWLSAGRFSDFLRGPVPKST